MKKALLLLAASAFATASFAQTTPTTEVKERDNGTKKIVTTDANGETSVTKTGKTNVGAALENTADAAGNVASKTGEKASRIFKKGKKKTQKPGYKVGKKLRQQTNKLEKKTE